MMPADRNGVVGIKPTVGLLSGIGLIPESHNQDTVGIFGRTIIDAALALDALAIETCKLPFLYIDRINSP